jgi:hypothetical protein
MDHEQEDLKMVVGKNDEAVLLKGGILNITV